MKWYAENAVQRPLCALIAAGAVLTMITATCAGAQEQASERKSQETYQTLYLTNLTDARDINDVVSDLRNMLPMAKVYRVESANAVSIRATAEDFATAQKILADIDRPRKTYRLTYTVGDGEGAHTAQHLVVVVSQGNKTTLKQGTRVPIVTGSYGKGEDQNTQVQYMDVGTNLDALLDGAGDGLRLRTKMEQTSVAEEKSNVGIQDPVIRQAVLEGESAIVIGKPVVLGSLDMPGGKQMEVSVLAEVVK